MAAQGCWSWWQLRPWLRRAGRLRWLRCGRVSIGSGHFGNQESLTGGFGLKLVLKTAEQGREIFWVLEFLSGRKSIHTRTAYERAVRKFLEWCDQRALELHTIRPMHVTEYMDGFGSVAKRQQHLAALRHFFDLQVTRRVVR